MANDRVLQMMRQGYGQPEDKLRRSRLSPEDARAARGGIGFGGRDPYFNSTEGQGRSYGRDRAVIVPPRVWDSNTGTMVQNTMGRTMTREDFEKDPTGPSYGPGQWPKQGGTLPYGVPVPLMDSATETRRKQDNAQRARYYAQDPADRMSQYQRTWGTDGTNLGGFYTAPDLHGEKKNVNDWYSRPSTPEMDNSARQSHGISDPRAGYTDVDLVDYLNDRKDNRVRFSLGGDATYPEGQKTGERGLPGTKLARGRSKIMVTYLPEGNPGAMDRISSLFGTQFYSPWSMRKAKLNDPEYQASTNVQPFIGPAAYQQPAYPEAPVPWEQRMSRARTAPGGAAYQPTLHGNIQAALGDVGYTPTDSFTSSGQPVGSTQPGAYPGAPAGAGGGAAGGGAMDWTRAFAPPGAPDAMRLRGMTTAESNAYRAESELNAMANRGGAGAAFGARTVGERRALVGTGADRQANLNRTTFERLAGEQPGAMENYQLREQMARQGGGGRGSNIADLMRAQASMEGVDVKRDYNNVVRGQTEAGKWKAQLRATIDTEKLQNLAAYRKAALDRADVRDTNRYTRERDLIELRAKEMKGVNAERIDQETDAALGRISASGLTDRQKIAFQSTLRAGLITKYEEARKRRSDMPDLSEYMGTDAFDDLLAPLLSPDIISSAEQAALGMQ